DGAHHPLLVPIELRAVSLPATPEHADAVLEHRDLVARHLPPLGRPLEALQAAALQIRRSDRVRQDQPGRAGAILSHQTHTGPGDLLEDLPEPLRVAPMNFLHTRVITIVERTVGC